MKIIASLEKSVSTYVDSEASSSCSQTFAETGACLGVNVSYAHVLGGPGACLPHCYCKNITYNQVINDISGRHLSSYMVKVQLLNYKER